MNRFPIIESEEKRKIREHLGYDFIVEVDASKLRTAIELSSPGSMTTDAKTSDHIESVKIFDDYPKVGIINSGGITTIGADDGRTRINLAAKRGQKIAVATDQASLDEILKSGLLGFFTLIPAKSLYESLFTHLIVKELSVKDQQKLRLNNLHKEVRKRIKAAKAHMNKELRKKEIAENRSKRANFQSPPEFISVISKLNQKIEAKVISNMGSPSLVNRTGRFASSVRITRLIKDAKSLVLGYTYQASPYQVFEQSALGAAPWNLVPQRDPRVIIEKSIRELMQEEAIRKFRLVKE